MAIKNTSESDPRSYDESKAVAKPKPSKNSDFNEFKPSAIIILEVYLRRQHDSIALLGRIIN